MNKIKNIGTRRLLVMLKKAYLNEETKYAEELLVHIRKNMNENEILRMDMEIKLDNKTISSKEIKLKKLYTFDEIIKKHFISKVGTILKLDELDSNPILGSTKLFNESSNKRTNGIRTFKKMKLK